MQPSLRSTRAIGKYSASFEPLPADRRVSSSVEGTLYDPFEVTRQGFCGKDALEKARLSNRTGGFFRYEDIQNPLAAIRGCPSQLDDRKWMTSGPACEDINSREREDARDKRDEMTETRRARNLTREEHRLYAINANEQANKDRVTRLQADPMVGRKNLSGQQGYNILNHNYHLTPLGARMEHHDNTVKYHGRCRGALIASRGHLGFNPVLGEQTYSLALPPPPRPRALAMGWTEAGNCLGPCSETGSRGSIGSRPRTGSSGRGSEAGSRRSVGSRPDMRGPGCSPGSSIRDDRRDVMYSSRSSVASSVNRCR